MKTITIAGMAAILAGTIGLMTYVQQIVAETKHSPDKEYVTMNDFEKSRATDNSTEETAVVAGGCFWGMEDIIRDIPGVIRTTVGYTGGKTKNPTYEQICTGMTGHAEAIEVVFDPSRLSYEVLLDFFYRMHDPTTLNRQHNDVGTQYRSAIFYTSDKQKETAEKVTRAWSESGKFKKPITTEISPASVFYSAEEYHQDYLVKHPNGYTCHVLRD